MPDIIQLLPDSVANQIAAGEVIQRPASVVKELVENAIDAGSTDIKINLTDAGKTLIQIIDHGSGMSDTDARMAFERHATSKIRNASDLFEILTLGFRGEALASIAAIAQVTLKTKKTDDELGTQINISGSEVLSQESINCSNGSNFIIQNLFYNIPARRKFLKSNSTELKYIITEFQRFSLTNPGINFSLIHNNEEIFHLVECNLLQRIAQLFRKNINQSLVKVSTETSIVNISGYIGKPDHAKKSMGEQFFFVNNRFMRHSYFHKAVMAAYANILPSDEYPSYFIYLLVDPQTVDINIHPTKTEIKFEDEVNIWKIINLSVKESIGKFNISPSLDFEMQNNINIPVIKSNTEIHIPEVRINPEYNPFESSGNSYQKQSFSSRKKDFLDNWDKLYQDFENGKNSGEIDFEKDEIPLTNEFIESNNQEVAGTILFQLKNKYILSSVKSGMMIIDQRRAHIRILFERYKNLQNSGQGFSQRQMFPIQFDVNPHDNIIITELMPELRNIGFELEKKNDNSYAILGIPADIDIYDPGKLIDSLIQHYKNTGDEIRISERDKIALSLSKAYAIEYGKVMSNEEMNELFNGLFSCETPTYTPDGKLIIKIIDIDEIEEKFK